MHLSNSSLGAQACSLFTQIKDKEATCVVNKATNFIPECMFCKLERQRKALCTEKFDAGKTAD